MSQSELMNELNHLRQEDAAEWKEACCMSFKEGMKVQYSSEIGNGCGVVWTILSDGLILEPGEGEFFYPFIWFSDVDDIIGGDDE